MKNNTTTHNVSNSNYESGGVSGYVTLLSLVVRWRLMRIAELFKVTIEERPLPKLEHPDDALIKVTTAAICGSGIVYSSNCL
jgi:hypothetical protein